MSTASDPYLSLYYDVIQCQQCSRLRAWSIQGGMHPPRRFREWIYWMKPVPGWGDLSAPRIIWVIGLAPALHGANRTGRMFTGDRSGEWLYRALYLSGLASHPHSKHHADPLTLHGVYVSAIVRCAPPGNRPSPEEQANCSAFLLRERTILQDKLRVVVLLGRMAYARVCRLFGWKPSPPFQHLQIWQPEPSLWCITSYHPSQQNTFTGKLTWDMWMAVWTKARQLRDS